MANKAIYLQINYSDGKLFEYSKEAKVGFDPHLNKDGEPSGYRYYHEDGLAGIFLGARMKDGHFGKELELSFGVGEQLYHIQTGLLNQSNDQLTDYAESIVVRLPNMNLGEVYRVFPYSMPQEEGSQYMKKGVSFKSFISTTNVFKDWPAVEKAVNYQRTGEEIADPETTVPALVWETNFAGNKAPTASSKEARLNFLGALLTKELVRLKSTKADSGSSTYTPPNVKTSAKTNSGPVQKNITAEDARPQDTPDLDFPTSDGVIPPSGNADDDLPF
jgi:hypothetical protein